MIVRPSETEKCVGNRDLPVGNCDSRARNSQAQPPFRLPVGVVPTAAARASPSPPPLHPPPATARTALLCKNGRGQIHNFTTLFPGTISKRCVGSLVAVAELVAVTAELIAMSASLDPARPWAHPLAAQWDATTFGAWLRRRLPTPEAYRYMCLTVEPDLSQSVDAVSLLHAVFLAKTGGGVGPGLYAFNQGYRIVGGI